MNKTFSILERIDVGETTGLYRLVLRYGRLSVSSNGSTWVKLVVDSLESLTRGVTFSILERIDVGETFSSRMPGVLNTLFQYPRTDRRG